MPDLYERGPQTTAEDLALLVDWADSEPPGPVKWALARILLERQEILNVLGRVRQMRQAQREYFRTRGNLPTCRAMESRVDGLLKTWE